MKLTTAIDAVLGDIDFELLTQEEAAEYVAIMEQALGDVWSLTPKQLYAEEVWRKVDWLLYGGAAGGAKQLALSSRLPTPSGWTTMGEVGVGDELFTERGEVCRVLQLHPVDHNAVAYRLTFDDGSTVEADADHRWWTYDAAELIAATRRNDEWRAARRAKRPSRVTGKPIPPECAGPSGKTLPAPVGGIRTTAEIAATLTTASGRRNHAIPVCDQIDLPEVKLPIDPYVLGAWLGDGTSANSGFTGIDPEIWGEIKAAGYEMNHYDSRSHWIVGLNPALRRLGLLRSKHIPAIYLRASAKQRLALLQGLMDTDGTVRQTGACSFVNTNERIARGVHELACSLGIKASIAERRTKLNGEDKGPCWMVRFTSADPVFRLPRKLERQQNSKIRRTTQLRYIVSCDRIDPMPMRCITVSNPTGIFLCGDSFIPTHNSELAIHHVNRLSQEIPGHSSLLMRRSIPELRRSLIIRLIGRIARFGLPAKYGKVDGQPRFLYTNGSIVECGHCQTEEAVGRYLSAEYDCVVIDEATTVTENQITRVASRLRTTREKALLGARPHLGLFTNPGGISHAWMYDLFITPTHYGQQIIVYDVSQGLERKHIVASYEAPINVATATAGEIMDVLLPWIRGLEIEADPATHLVCGFVPSKATDNPYLDPSYLKNLNTLDERRRRQLRDGDWDTFAGQYFETWNRAIHVIEPFEIPDGWYRARGIDWGSTSPFACVYGAWDPDGNCYIYREEYGAGLSPTEQAKKVLAPTVPGKREKFGATVADPSVFSDRRGTGKSIADMWRDAGMNTTRAKNQRPAGWANMKQYMWDPMKVAPNGEYGWPRLFVFSNCTNLARTIPLMQVDSHNDEDLDTTLEDHAVDACRYLLAVRPMSAQQRKEAPPMGADARFAQMVRRLDKRKRKW